MKTLNLAMTMIVATLALAGCEDIGPATLQVQVDRTFDLETTKDKRIVLAAGSTTPITVDLDGKNVKLTFTDGQKAVFKNAKFNKDTGRAVIAAEKSGQKTAQGERLGLEIGRTALCAPNCVDTERSEYERSCTACDYEWVQRCRWVPDSGSSGSWDNDHRRNGPGRRGHEVCSREYECVRSWRGTETVYNTRKITHYTVDGRIFGAKQGALATGLGTYDEVDTSSTTSSCN